MVNWNCLPSSIQQCATFVFATNADRRQGQVDTMQTLAAKAACGCLNAYFTRLRSAIDDGELDPLTRDEVRELVDAFPEEDCGNDWYDDAS